MVSVSGTGYASVVLSYEPDFTNYELTVRTSPGLTAISQGDEPEKGIFTLKLNILYLPLDW